MSTYSSIESVVMYHSLMISRARSICSFLAGQTFSPDSSCLDGVRWYAGISVFALVVGFVLFGFSGDISFSALRFAGPDIMVDAWSCRACVEQASSSDARGECRLLKEASGDFANL